MPVFATGERQIDQVVAVYGSQGILYLTDRRLIFEYSVGLVNKKNFQFGITLSQIQSVAAKHGMLGSQEIVITAKDANNGFKSNSFSIRIAMHPEVWINKINSTIAALTPVYQPSIMTTQQTTIVEREVVKVPCQYCRTLNDLARSKTCSQCGAPIYKG
jgi:ABC-type uncharacterized transport system YnjBCD substrate-binding protein